MWIEEAVGGGEATSEELPKETPKSEIGEKEERGEGERADTEPGPALLHSRYNTPDSASFSCLSTPVCSSTYAPLQAALQALEAKADLDSCSPLFDVTLTNLCSSLTHNNNLKIPTELQEGRLTQQRQRALNPRPASLDRRRSPEDLS